MSWFTFAPNDFAISFLSILFEGLPFLLLGSLVSGIVDAWVSPAALTRMLPANRGAAILVSGLLGLVFPMCECGSVVVIRRFIRKGLPVSCAVTYMLAAPIVSPVVALSTYAAFKGQSPALMTSLRLVAGYMLAVGIGFVVQRIPVAAVLHPSLPTPQSAHAARPRMSVAPTSAGKPPGKIAAALSAATSDFLDVAFFLVIGAAIAAVFNTAIDQRLIAPLASREFPAIVAMMALAFLLAVCSTSDAFIAASFVAFPAVAKLAFLLFGPMLDIKLVFLYATTFRKRFILGLAVGLFLLVALACRQLAVVSP